MGCRSSFYRQLHDALTVVACGSGQDEVSPEAEPEAESLMSQDFTAEFIQQVERVNLAFDRKMAELEQRFQDMQSEEERISDARAAPPAPPLDAHRPDGAWDEGPSSSASCGGGGARGAQPRHLELRWRQRSRSASPKRSPTASVGRGVSESEKMARLTELQKEQFQLVCKELYQDCLTLKQVCDLNFTGLSKALKKYTKSMRRLAKGGGDDAAAAAGPGAVTYSANLKEQPFYIGIKRLEKVVPVPEKARAMERLPRHVAGARHRRAEGVLLVSVRLCASFPEANPIPSTGRAGGGRDRGKLCEALHRQGHGPSAASAAPPAPTRPRKAPPARPDPCLSFAPTRMLVFVPTRRVTSWGAGEQHGLRRLPAGGLRVGAAGDCVGGCVRAGTGHLSFLHRLTPFGRPGLPCAPHAPHLALGLVSVPPDRLASRSATSSRLSIQGWRYVCVQGVFGQLPLHALDEPLHRARLRPLHSCLTPLCSRALRPYPVSRWPPLPTQSQVCPHVSSPAARARGQGSRRSSRSRSSPTSRSSSPPSARGKPPLLHRRAACRPCR